MDLTVEVVNQTEYEGADAIYVGRPSALSNPFSIKQHGRDQAMKLYKQWLNLQYLTENRRVINVLKSLVKQLRKDKKIVLSCWCAPEVCHAHLIGQALLKMASWQELKNSR